MMFMKAWWRSRGRVSRHFLIKDGGIIPRWFGVAYFDPVTMTALVLPIPLNLGVGIARRAWCWCKNGVRPSVHDRAVAKAFDRGKREGYELAGRETIRRLFDLPRGGS